MADDSIKPVYVLYGSDGWLLDANRRRIVARIAADADPQVCVVSFDASAELPDVLDELRTLPFLAPRRAVIIRDADAFVSAHRQAIESYLQKPTRTASLVLVVSSWPSNTRLYKIVAKIGEAIRCRAAEGEALISWLNEAAGRRGKQLDRQAAAMLAKMADNDLAVLDGEIEKLSLYVGRRKTITTEDVSLVVTATAGAVDFALSNALAAGDSRAALTALDAMMGGRGEEFRIVGTIAWHLRRVMGAQQLAAHGQRPDAALRMPYRQKQTILALLKRRSLSALAADFRRLAAADIAMKTSADPAACLQQLVVQLCS